MPHKFISAEALQALQFGLQAQRDAQPRLSEREFAQSLTELMVRLLHYQDRGEPDWNQMTMEEWEREIEKLPQVMVDRYRDDVWFHMQVDRVVTGVLDLINRRKSDYAR